MTGLHEIKDARSLTIAKSIWDAREELAIEKDIAPGRLIPDSAIVAAVKEMPKTKPELASLKTFSGRASRTFLDTWWAAFVEGNTTRQLVELRAKPTGIPNHRNWPIKFPEANARLVASRAAIATLSESMKIPPENILSPDTLRAICYEPPLDLSRENVSSYLNQKRARQWQIEATNGLLIETLQVKTVEAKVQTQDSAE
jgi:ribonuclease D